MINIGDLRDPESRKHVIANLTRRGVVSSDIENLVALDELWRSLTSELDVIRAEKNAANADIANASDADRQQLITKMKEVAEKEKALAQQTADALEKRDALWRTLPNLITDDVPDGGESDFRIEYESDFPKPEGAVKDYLTLVGDSIDLERAAKVSGSRFAYITGKLARLEMALVSYMFDSLAEHNFLPVMPPVLVKKEAMEGMGYLDKNPEEIYQTQDDLYLVGTSEQAIGPMHMNEVLEEETLPRRYVGFSSCFRREAGSHGKDVRGILRLHQFEKVEMFSFTNPENSDAEHAFLLDRQKDIMNALELPYRVITLAAKDTGNPSTKTHDIETWIPSENTYRETHSTSNTTDYQARRLNVRIKTASGNVHAHMLNGTAIALSRILIAIIENHQQADGSIAIPKTLHPYLPFTTL